MPLITDIKPQKNKKRFNIYLDGQFAFGLSAEALTKAGLAIDKEISSKKVEELIKEDEFIKFYDRALKFLSYRPRSEKEIKDWFKKKMVGIETQKLIEKKLRQYNYLNDEEFARWWIEQRTTFRPSGARLIALELRQKGVSKDLIAKLLDSYLAKDTEHEMAKRVVEKKMKSLRHLHKPVEIKQKLTAVLARRGFSWEIIREVLVDEKIEE